MHFTLDEALRQNCGRATAAAEKAFAYLIEYGMRILVLVCLLAAVILLVWAHWAA